MALEYLINTLDKDIKIFDVLNKLIDETEDFLEKYEIGANEKIDESTTLNKEVSGILVDKILSESFPEKKDQEDGEEEEKIKIFEADKKIRFASKFVQLMRFKIYADEGKRLFNELREQKKEQKRQYEEAEKKKREEEKKKKEEELKKQDNQQKQNEKNTINNQSNDKDNNKKNNLGNGNNHHGNITNNKINIIDKTDNNQNGITTEKSSTSLKQIEHPINKKNILIKSLAWILTLVFVSLCVYFFIQAATVNAIITLILTIIITIASILLTVYLPNKKGRNINKIEMPLNEKNDIYIDLNKSPNQQGRTIAQNKQK